MLLVHFFTPKIAHSSYLLGGSQSCAIIDPRRDTQVYIDAAKSLGMSITHILETHLHADFISGHLDLAQKTGATIVGIGSIVNRAPASPFKERFESLISIEIPAFKPDECAQCREGKAVVKPGSRV